MTVPTIREVPYGSDLYRLMLDFRDAELRRPLGMALTAADQADEEAQRHFAAVLDGESDPQLCASVVMKPLPPEPGRPARAKLRQMAVAPAFRGLGLGRRLVRFAEAAMAAGDIAEVELGARESAVGFYERLGYAVVGDPFTEVGQPHRPMRRRLKRQDGLGQDEAE